MGSHRFLDEMSACHEPTPVPQDIHWGAFMMCPLARCSAFANQDAGWQQQLYQLAFARAQAAAHRPSPFQGDWIDVWN